MKVMIVALALVALAAAASVPGPPETAAVLRSEYDQQPDGAYLFGFETDNGIKREEKGELKQVTDEENKPQTVVVVRGQFSYIDDTGKVETIEYTADENGYRATGDSIPTGPARR